MLLVRLGFAGAVLTLRIYVAVAARLTISGSLRIRVDLVNEAYRCFGASLRAADLVVAVAVLPSGAC